MASLRRFVKAQIFDSVHRQQLTRRQDELEGYKAALRQRELQLPRASTLDKKLEALRRLVAYELTNDEITAMVDRKNFLRRKYDPETRERLQRSIDEARQAKNHVFANQLQDELDSLGKPSGLAFRTSLNPQSQPTSSSDQQERLARLNAENRRRNNEAVRRAQIQERQRAREIEQKLARGETVDDDPSRRLRTRAKFMHDFDGDLPKSPTPGAGAAANGSPAKAGAKAAAALVPEIARLQEKKYAESKGVPTIHKPLMDDDIIGSLDLDIDVEIE